MSLATVRHASPETMFTPDQYRLLDFGDGRRLESFGSVLLDRVCPAAEGIAKATPEVWREADARFERGSGGKGQWKTQRPLPERWQIVHGAFTLDLKRTDVGHLGIFPEQASNWDWIAGQVRRAARPLKVLNLFAYTGGSTLAAAGAGAEVTHVDSARNTVAWAQGNAERSGLGDAPIRWIAEDAAKFVRREIKRGNRYDAVILDPPSYGHGPRGEVWRAAKHLPPLLKMCCRLTDPNGRFVLLTCHTPKLDVAKLREMLSGALVDPRAGRSDARALTIRSEAGRALPCGICVRWEG